jgi:predicted GTPase
MSFIETEASVRYETVNGKKVMIITPKCEVTLTNMKTGQEYMSDAESNADVNNPETETKREDIRRDVKITVEEINLGAGSEL